uniref:Uncharacterized protein n=1 Tax=Anguilla anguilla TaxID=7936 RepID=A0A0E9SHX7_ANGAN
MSHFLIQYRLTQIETITASTSLLKSSIYIQ